VRLSEEIATGGAMAEVRALEAYVRELLTPAPAAAISDDQIVAAWQAMPGGPEGWLKSFGFIQFARTVLALRPEPEKPAMCTVPPAGWVCTRGAGHDGPCAAHPETQGLVGGVEALMVDIRRLPTVRAVESDGEESDGTPRRWRDRPFVSLTQLERLLRERRAVARC
jgi:hypothetical protein